MAKSKEIMRGERDTLVSMVDSLFEKAKEERGKFLLDYGWEYGCDYPDFCWRWSKIINGKRICLSAREAFIMERNCLEPVKRGSK